jgi:hypothetical protein
MIGINFYMTLGGLHYSEILMLPLGGLYMKDAVPSQHLL